PATIPGPPSGPLSIDDAAGLTLERVIESVAGDTTQGLNKDVAAERLRYAGANRISQVKNRSVFDILVSQFKSSVVLLLVIAAGISAGTHEYVQMAAILIAVVINASIGFATEFRSMLSLRALEELSGPVARVRRDGIDLE